jgi:hypothetical protein
MKIMLTISPLEKALRVLIERELKIYLEDFNQNIMSDSFSLGVVIHRMTRRLEKLKMPSYKFQSFTINMAVSRYIYLKLLSQKLNKPVNEITESDVYNAKPIQIPTFYAEEMFGIIRGGFPFTAKKIWIFKSPSNKSIVGSWDIKSKRYVARTSDNILLGIILENGIFYYDEELFDVVIWLNGIVPCKQEDLRVILNTKNRDIIGAISENLTESFCDNAKDHFGVTGFYREWDFFYSANATFEVDSRAKKMTVNINIVSAPDDYDDQLIDNIKSTWWHGIYKQYSDYVYSKSKLSELYNLNINLNFNT